MKRIEIEQGTIEWHETKYRKIGGTLSSGLFVDSDTLLKKLIGQNMEDFEDEEHFSNDATLRGHELEPYARKELNKYTGLEFKEVGWLQCKEIKILGISPDGITDDDKNSCELKCLSRDKHTSILMSGEIPKEHIPQCLHYFTINPKLETHYFVSYRPENKVKPLFVKKLTRDTLIDMGYKKEIEIEQFGVKGQNIKSKFKKVPDLKTISELVEIAKKNAKQLEKDIETGIDKLSF